MQNLFSKVMTFVFVAEIIGSQWKRSTIQASPGSREHDWGFARAALEDA
jgi:hypothetical protein